MLCAVSLLKDRAPELACLKFGGGGGGGVEGGALEPPPPRSELPEAYSPHDWPPLSRLDLPPPPGVCPMACT